MYFFYFLFYCVFSTLDWTAPITTWQFYAGLEDIVASFIYKIIIIIK